MHSLSNTLCTKEYYKQNLNYLMEGMNEQMAVAIEIFVLQETCKAQLQILDNQ